MNPLNLLSNFFKLFIVSISIFFVANVSQAEPVVVVKTNYYSVSGDTAAQLKDQMWRKGENGWWGYTRWFVRWTGACQITVAVTYTLPRWINKHSAPAGLKKSWERMMANLRTHEEGHAQFGINAAQEISRSGCNANQHAIVRKWAHQDKVYDNRTRSGLTQGVTLQQPSISAAASR